MRDLEWGGCGEEGGGWPSSAQSPRRDPWHLLVFDLTGAARRELDGYGAKKLWSWTTSCGTGPVVISRRAKRRILMMKGGKGEARRCRRIRRVVGTYFISQWSNEDVDRPSPVEVVKIGPRPRHPRGSVLPTRARAGAGGRGGTATFTAAGGAWFCKIVRWGSTPITLVFSPPRLS